MNCKRSYLILILLVISSFTETKKNLDTLSFGRIKSSNRTNTRNKKKAKLRLCGNFLN